MAAPSDQEAVHTLLLTGVRPSGGVGPPDCGEAHGSESVGYGVLKKYYHDHLLRSEVGKVISVDFEPATASAIVKVKVKPAAENTFLGEVQGNLKRQDRPETAHFLYSESCAITFNWNTSVKSLAGGIEEYAIKHYPAVVVKNVEGVCTTIAGTSHDVLCLQHQYSSHIARNFHSLIPRSEASPAARNLSGDAGGKIKEYPGFHADVLALFKKLPEGNITGVSYDIERGCVLIDTGAVEEESTLSHVKTTFKKITSSDLKAGGMMVPGELSDHEIRHKISTYDAKYGNCVFVLQQDPRAIKVVSNSSRQFEQAKKMLENEFRNTSDEASIGAPSKASSEGMVIPLPNGRKLTLKRANIVLEDVDIIVNAANRNLEHGGGVAGAIDKASKGMVQKDSRDHIRRCGPLQAGQVAVTQAGGSLKCKRIIHAVGPMKSGNNDTACKRLLYDVIENVLKKAQNLNAHSISLPAISSGIFGVAVELVARCMIESILYFKYSEPLPVLSDIRIVIIDHPTHSKFAQVFAKKLSAIPLHKPSLVDRHKSVELSEKRLPSTGSSILLSVDEAKIPGWVSIDLHVDSTTPNNPLMLANHTATATKRINSSPLLDSVHPSTLDTDEAYTTDVSSHLPLSGPASLPEKSEATTALSKTSLTHDVMSAAATASSKSSLTHGELHVPTSAALTTSSKSSRTHGEHHVTTSATSTGSSKSSLTHGELHVPTSAALTTSSQSSFTHGEHHVTTSATPTGSSETLIHGELHMPTSAALTTSSQSSLTHGEHHVTTSATPTGSSETLIHGEHHVITDATPTASSKSSLTHHTPTSAVSSNNSLTRREHHGTTSAASTTSREAFPTNGEYHLTTSAAPTTSSKCSLTHGEHHDTTSAAPTTSSKCSLTHREHHTSISAASTASSKNSLTHGEHGVTSHHGAMAGSTPPATVSKDVETLSLKDDAVKIRPLLQTLAKKWYLLGHLLGFDDNSLNKISSVAGDDRSYLDKVISQWLCGDSNQRPTLKGLVMALRHAEIGGDRVASQILEAYHVTTERVLSIESEHSGMQLSEEMILQFLQPMCSKWRVLGIALGASQEDKLNIHGDPMKCLQNIVSLWLSGQCSQPPTLECLTNTLRLCTLKEDHIAAALEQALLKMPCEEDHTVGTGGDGSGIHYPYVPPFNESGSSVDGGKTEPSRKVVDPPPGFRPNHREGADHSSIPPHLLLRSMSAPYASLPVSLETSTVIPSGSVLATGVGGGVTEELAAAYDLEKKEKEKANVAPSDHKRNSLGSFKKYHSDDGHRRSSHSKSTGGSKRKKSIVTCSLCSNKTKSEYRLDSMDCKHGFCLECFSTAVAAHRWCPVCPRLVVHSGSQPLHGKMTHEILDQSLPGYEGSKTIKIKYDIPEGIQGQNHPNPGVKYVHTIRIAYLPHTPEGCEIFHLLQKAFDAGLIFTVTRNMTSDGRNILNWSDIRHKTSMNGKYGYPDPTYLERVRQQLADKGVVPDETTV